MGPVLATDSKPSYMMKAFAIVLLAAVAVKAEADADAYTIGQVNHGFTHGGIITGVDYGHGAVSGVGAIGNRYAVPVVNHATYAGPYAAGVYSGVHGVYGGIHSGVHGIHAYGKREAEADAEADPHFYNGVYGTGVYGHHAGVVGHHAGVVSTHSVVPAVHSAVAAVNHVVPAVHHATVAAVPAVTAVHSAIPAVHSTVGGYTQVSAPSVYNHGVHGVYYGKREAEADAEADPYFYNGVYGHHAGVVSTHSVVPTVHPATVAAVPAVRTVVPAVHSTVAAVNHVVPTVHSTVAAVPAVHTGVYSGVHGVSSI